MARTTSDVIRERWYPKTETATTPRTTTDIVREQMGLPTANDGYKKYSKEGMLETPLQLNGIDLPQMIQNNKSSQSIQSPINRKENTLEPRVSQSNAPLRNALSSASDVVLGDIKTPEQTVNDALERRMTRQYDPSNNIDRIALKYQLGKLTDQEGKEWSKVVSGAADTTAKSVSLEIQSMLKTYPELLDDMPAGSDNVLSRVGSFLQSAAEGVAEMAPTMINAQKQGALLGAPSALGAAGTAAIAGQIGPQILAPEEILTVPGAAITGYKLGSTSGVSDYMYNVERGQSYKSMIDDGVSPEIAVKYATLVGAANAGLELAQFGELAKAFKTTGEIGQALSNSTLKKYLNQKGIKAATSYLTGVAKETGQEVAQEAVSIAGETAGKKEAGIYATILNDENKNRIIDTAIQSAKAFALLQGVGTVSGSAYRTAMDKRNSDVQTVIEEVKSSPELLSDKSYTDSINALTDEIQTSNTQVDVANQKNDSASGIEKTDTRISFTEPVETINEDTGKKVYTFTVAENIPSSELVAINREVKSIGGGRYDNKFYVEATSQDEAKSKINSLTTSREALQSSVDNQEKFTLDEPYRLNQDDFFKKIQSEKADWQKDIDEMRAEVEADDGKYQPNDLKYIRDREQFIDMIDNYDARMNEVKSMEMSPLTGSEKQVSFAESIRNKKIETLEKNIESVQTKAGTDLRGMASYNYYRQLKLLKQETSAKNIIDNRFDNNEYLKSEYDDKINSTSPASPIVSRYEAWSSSNNLNPYKSTSSVEKVKPVHEIMNDIKRDFKVGITTSRYRARKAYAHYKSFPQVIESRIANTIAPLMHELGHHFDHRYTFYNSELVNNLVKKMPEEFTRNYKTNELKHEAIAEFVRLYLTMPGEAKEFGGDFYDVFEKALSETGDLKMLQATRENVLSWLNAATKDQIKSTIISRMGKSKISQLKSDFKGQLQLLGKKAYMYFVDELQPLNDFVSYVEKATGKKLSGSSNAYLLAQQSLDAPMIAKQITTTAMLDSKNNVIGKSFKSNFEKIDAKNHSDFSNYLICRRAIDYWDRGKRTFSDDISIDYVQKVIDEYDISNPEFKEASNGLYKWWQKFTEAWIVDTGLLDQDVYSHMKEIEPHYVPFFRQRNEDVIINGMIKSLASRGYADQRSPIKRSSLKGSSDPIFDPVESMIIEIERYVTTVKRRDVMLSIHKIYQSLLKDAVKGVNIKDGLGYIINQVNPRMAPDSVNMSDKKIELSLALYDEFFKTMTPKEKGEYNEIKKQISLGDADYIELIDYIHNKGFNAIEAVDSIINDTEMEFKPMEFDKEKNIITLKDENGKTVHYEIYDRYLLEALLNTDNSNIDFVTRQVAGMRRIMQSLITTFDPTFVVRNIARDVSQGFVASDISMKKYHATLIKAITEEITNGDWAKQYRQMGGGFASPTGASRNALNESMAGVIPGWKKAHPIETVLQTVERVSDAVEQAPRLAEYINYVEKYGDSFENRLEAIYKSKDVTVNFKRKGQIMRRWYGNFIPFLNAALQGIDKTVRMNTKDIKKTLPRALVGVTLTSLIVYALNRDDENYKNANKYIRDNYYLLPTGTPGKWIRIPKPREIGMLYGSTFERAIDAAIKKDPEAWEGYFSDLINVFMPPTDLITQGISDALHNETWYGGDIVPYAYQELQKDQQWDDRTSYFAKQIAKIIPDGSNLSSPMIIDYLLKQYTGVIGKTLIPATDNIKGNTFENFTSSFTSDVAYSNNVVSKFYDRYRSMQSAISTLKFGRDTKNAEEALLNDTFKNTSDAMKELRSLHDQIDNMEKSEYEATFANSGLSKDEAKRVIKLEILRIADEANKKYNDVMNELND